MANTEFQVDYSDMKQAYKHCVDKIVELKKTKKMLVGATTDVEEAQKNHATEDKLKTMYVLLKIDSTQRRAMSLEEKLLNRFGKSKQYAKELKVDDKNKVKYESNLPKKGPYYIYVVFK